MFFFPTRLGLHVDGLCLGELEGGDPPLALHFRVGLQVVGLRTSVGDDKVARVLHGDVCSSQVDGSPARVAHLGLRSEQNHV